MSTWNLPPGVSTNSKYINPTDEDEMSIFTDEDKDYRLKADRWMRTKDIDSESGPVATPCLQCPHCQSSLVYETLKTRFISTTCFFCEECDRESLPIQPDDGY